MYCSMLIFWPSLFFVPFDDFYLILGVLGVKYDTSLLYYFLLLTDRACVQ